MAKLWIDFFSYTYSTVHIQYIMYYTVYVQYNTVHIQLLYSHNIT